MKRVALLMLLPAWVFAGTISLGSGSISVFGGYSDSSAPPAYVNNPSAFAFVLTDGITTNGGQQRRNTDPAGGANTALLSVPTFDGRQTTVSGTINNLTVADSEGDSGGHSQVFAIGLCTGGWRDQAAATYNLSLIGSQPVPSKDGFAGIAFGYKNGSLYLAGYDYDGQPNQIFFDLGKAGLASGQSTTSTLSFQLMYTAGTLAVSVNGQSLGSVPTSHDFSSALLVTMGASVDTANTTGVMTFSSLIATTPGTPGPPALLFPISGDRQQAAEGTTLPQPLVVGVMDAYRNPLAGLLVSFATGNSSASPASVATDASGQAATSVTLGSSPGDANVVASVTGLPLITFHLTVVGGSVVPTITAVLNGASFGTRIASGGWVAILGSNLSAATDIASVNGNSLPTSLDGVSVTIDGLPAFVYFVSPTQINAIVPDDPTNGGVNVQVTAQSVASNIVTADKEDFAPALFVFTSPYPAAAHADGTFLGPPNLLTGVATQPAKAGEVILLFGTGFGSSIPLVPAGQIVTSATPLALPISATVGGLPAAVQGYLVYPGMYQFNLTVPDLLPGDAPLSLSLAGAATQDGLMLTIGQ